MQLKDELIDAYKRHPFSPGLIPFEAGLKVLGSEFARIYVEQAGHKRWVVYDKKTKQPAVFCHAGVISSLDDGETGNYVPDGEDIPSGVDRKFVQHRVNAKCFYTYIFDTFYDISLYEGQWKLDEHMSKVKGFNPRGLPRREYLSGHEVKFRARFWMQTPMFLHKGPSDEPEPTPTHLHPWVLQAVEGSRGFRANPDRPRVWAKVDGDIVPIGDTEVQRLQRGDVVAVSFRLVIHETSVNWYPQFHPADLVLLQSGGGTTDYSAPAMGLYNLPPPSFEDTGETEADWQFVIEDVQRTAETAHGQAMEGIAQYGVATGNGGDDERAEDMEIDDGGRTTTEDKLVMPVTEQADSDDVDRFTMIVQEDGGEKMLGGGFVDVEAEEEGRRTTRGGKSRGTRGRMRDHSSFA